YDEMLLLGEQGLALLGEETESVEAALMNSQVAIASGSKGDGQKWREFTYRNAQFLERLPYSEELRAAYDHVFVVYRDEKNIEEAMEWLQALERRAQQNHDSIALGGTHYWAAVTLTRTGDLDRAIS